MCSTNMNENIEDAKLAFKKFRQQCVWLQEVYNIYSQLDPDIYKGDNCFNVYEIYKKTAPIFFNVAFHAIREYLFLQVARITDPSKQNGNANLSIPHINSLLENLKKETEEIKLLSDKILLFANPIREARNKIISHADKSTICNDVTLGGHSEEDAWPNFFINLQQYLNAIGCIVEVGTSDFSSIGYGSGDSSDLLRYLRAGIALHGDRGPFGRQAEGIYKWIEEKNIADELLRQYIKNSHN